MITLTCWNENSTQGCASYSFAKRATVEKFCDAHCGSCEEPDCCVSHDPSCALSRKMGVELEAEE